VIELIVEFLLVLGAVLAVIYLWVSLNEEDE
jgi:hypothetical protein